MARASSTRSKARETRLRERLDACAPGWAAVRLLYPGGVRAIADEVAERGLSLRDLMAMEIAEHEAMRVELARETSTRVKAVIVAAMVQSRKAMRALVLESQPSLSLSDQPVVLPEGMSYEELMARAERVDAEGDEIMS